MLQCLQLYIFKELFQVITFLNVEIQVVMLKYKGNEINDHIINCTDSDNRLLFLFTNWIING